MVKDRILSTLHFFDLQDTAVTLLELHNYLLREKGELKSVLDDKWEIKNNLIDSNPVSLDVLLESLNEECGNEVSCVDGYYVLTGREELVKKRLQNYLYGFQRERLIKRFVSGLGNVSFVRGVALGGSQPFGLQKEHSDIDLLIITDPNFMWLARALVTAYFQLTGRRRHGIHIANRFCLNHYLAGSQELKGDKNLYTAMEYGRLRPLVYPQTIIDFQNKNSGWMKTIFPHFTFNISPQKQSLMQKAGEWILNNGFGKALNNLAKKIQMPRIHINEFIVATDQELSFHPNNRKNQLFERFFA